MQPESNTSDDQANFFEQTLASNVVFQKSNASMNANEQHYGTSFSEPSTSRSLISQADLLAPERLQVLRPLSQQQHHPYVHSEYRVNFPNLASQQGWPLRQKVDSGPRYRMPVQSQLYGFPPVEVNQPSTSRSTAQHMGQYQEKRLYKQDTSFKHNQFLPPPPPPPRPYQLRAPSKLPSIYFKPQIGAQASHPSLHNTNVYNNNSLPNLPSENIRRSSIQSHSKPLSLTNDTFHTSPMVGGSKDENFSRDFNPEVTEKYVKEEAHKQFEKCPLAEIEKLHQLDIEAEDFVGVIPCVICGDESSGYSYGILICAECKDFIQKTLNTKRDTDEFACHLQCKINKDTRNDCKACRWAKSLNYIDYTRETKGKWDEDVEDQFISEALDILIVHAKGDQEQQNLFNQMMKRFYLKYENKHFKDKRFTIQSTKSDKEIVSSQNRVEVDFHSKVERSATDDRTMRSMPTHDETQQKSSQMPSNIKPSHDQPSSNTNTSSCEYLDKKQCGLSKENPHAYDVEMVDVSQTFVNFKKNEQFDTSTKQLHETGRPSNENQILLTNQLPSGNESNKQNVPVHQNRQLLEKDWELSITYEELVEVLDKHDV